jgi:hypothetical protein
MGPFQGIGKNFECSFCHAEERSDEASLLPACSAFEAEPHTHDTPPYFTPVWFLNLYWHSCASASKAWYSGYFRNNASAGSFSSASAAQ